MNDSYDIIVIGGGHAGAEAAHAAAALGARTALVTLSAATIGQMSCNPAIGGIGKGQIVREIDALGGLMGQAADATGIQFRMLNRSKGPAVWGPRCQSDRHAYAAYVQATLARQPNLTIVEGEAVEIVTDANRVTGVRVLLHSQLGQSVILGCSAAVITAGTFLNGLMHLGERTWPGGRYDEPAAGGLSNSLGRCGLEVGRLKTGTCPRLAAETIDTTQCVRQDGDAEPLPFSFLADRLDVRQEPCWLTQTTPEIHDAIRANLHRAPMYSGQIQSVGPRYCPSFETKVVRFADKDSHQIFLEPEGRGTNWVYCNGISTSMPPDVQDFMVAHIPGLQKARILRYGYAIEYDFCQPTQLRATLEAKCTRGLFLAGQINGTTGYEEAAAQGLLAGLNAALALAGREPLVLRRDHGYIGVMIDDLVTRGVTEPYRMFTSRSEHRLSLRSDNADRRLTEIGRSAGLVDDARWQRHQDKCAAIDRAGALLRSHRRAGKTLWELLQTPGLTIATRASGGDAPAAELAALLVSHPAAMETLGHDARYAGYLHKEQLALKQMNDLDSRKVPDDLDYALIAHLRHEAREKLLAIRPMTLGQALRISGITPADITVVAIHLAARKR